jgi:hypothetical protein
MMASSPLIGMVQMIQRIQESMLNITFRVHAKWLRAYSWSFSKKWRAILIVSAFTFISPVSSSMIAPAEGQVAEWFDIHGTVILAMTTSVFILGYGGYISFSPTDNPHSFIIAFGPLFIGPLSEIFGRSHVLQISNLWYLGTCFSLSS